MKRGFVVAGVAFVAGSITMVVMNVGAEEPASCDPSSKSSTVRELPSTGGFKTPEEALTVVVQSERDLSVPAESADVGSSGPDRAETESVDPDGNVAYTLYIDGAPRIYAFVQRLEDGTYGLAGWETCLRLEAS